MRLKIIGAGSIGNHMAHAARTLGWDVVVTDLDVAALARMREEIYPGRYGGWDPAIRLVPSHAVPRGGFDLIHIGTPPDTHLALAAVALDEQPRGLLIEKPLCPPSLDGLGALVRRAGDSSTRVFVGYDHVVGAAARATEALVRSGSLGVARTLDVEFREHWGGIFAAHPWLRGPADSYLGHWTRGGGASGEHSHATNLWQHLAHAAGAGAVSEVDAMVTYVSEAGATYDSLCLMSLRTENGFGGRVVQDVVTRPPTKRARLQCDQGAVEWVNGYDAAADAVIVHGSGRDPEVRRIMKQRPDDFIEELQHIATQLDTAVFQPTLSLERGIDTMLVLAAAHRSERERRRVEIAELRAELSAST